MSATQRALGPLGANGTPVVVTRFVPKVDPHNYLHRDVEVGEVFYLFQGPTYGCINYQGGIALSERPRENPFFEFPTDAVEAQA